METEMHLIYNITLASCFSYFWNEDILYMLYEIVKFFFNCNTVFGIFFKNFISNCQNKIKCCKKFIKEK